jgi:hypothetical protein
VSELHSFQESTAGSTCSSSTFSTSRASSRSRTERNPLTLATSAPSRELLKVSKLRSLDLSQFDRILELYSSILEIGHVEFKNYEIPQTVGRGH